MTGPARPLLLFDGDCAFCRAWIDRWRHATGDAVDYAPSQQHAERFPDVAPETLRRSVVLIEPGGRVATGAEAVFRALAQTPRGGAWLACYRRVPGFAAASEWLYGLVARHRDVAFALTRLLWGNHLVPPGERLTVWIFLRLIAAIYFCAFASLGGQILGLVGHDGLLPLEPMLASARHQIGVRAFWLLPTLGWWNASDGFLIGQCIAGAGAAVLLALGLAPAAMLALAWVLYLSLATAGQEFLWFQWDSLLLETGFLAIFVAPLTALSTPGRDHVPSRGAWWMLRWLVFRLMVSSAIVKWASGDPEWRHLTALTHHYETQPLPPWTAWYAHHLPRAFHVFSAAAMFAIEGLAPFLMLGPRRVRMLAVVALGFLQALILVTGNYGFFNALALALCVPLLDDAVWPAWLRRAFRIDLGAVAPPARRWPPAVRRPVLVTLLLLTLVPFVRSFRQPTPWLSPLVAVYRLTSPFHLTSPYGLFAVMTTTRPEITVEGSADGVTWKPYAFRWKPGDPGRRPEFMAPHMPRLDWQMWFAALDPDHVPPWLASLCGHLLLGSRPVLGLLAANPFPATPPRFVRARIADYRFTTPAERAATGAWWVAGPSRDWIPPLTLIDGWLVPVGLDPDAR